MNITVTLPEFQDMIILLLNELLNNPEQYEHWEVTESFIELLEALHQRSIGSITSRLEFKTNPKSRVFGYRLLNLLKENPDKIQLMV